MIEIPRDPPRKDLILFGAILGPFVALAGWMCRRHFESPHVGTAVWAVGAALWLVFVAVPPSRRPIYVGWMRAVFPIGWVVSHVIVIVFYYLVLTPIALLLRLFGHDSMRRRAGSGASYWVARERRDDTRRYFRQY